MADALHTLRAAPRAVKHTAQEPWRTRTPVPLHHHKGIPELSQAVESFEYIWFPLPFKGLVREAVASERAKADPRAASAARSARRARGGAASRREHAEHQRPAGRGLGEGATIFAARF